MKKRRKIAFILIKTRKKRIYFEKARKKRKNEVLKKKTQKQTFFKNYLGRHMVTLAHLHEKKRKKHEKA
jgi:hypothetical protein